MKMELMQPFINSLDAVIAETMGCSAEIADVTMEEGNFKRTGIAALVAISGEIEGGLLVLYVSHDDFLRDTGFRETNHFRRGGGQIS